MYSRIGLTMLISISPNDTEIRRFLIRSYCQDLWIKIFRWLVDTAVRGWVAGTVASALTTNVHLGSGRLLRGLAGWGGQSCVMKWNAPIDMCSRM